MTLGPEMTTVPLVPLLLVPDILVVVSSSRTLHRISRRYFSQALVVRLFFRSSAFLIKVWYIQSRLVVEFLSIFTNFSIILWRRIEFRVRNANRIETRCEQGTRFSLYFIVGSFAWVVELRELRAAVMLVSEPARNSPCPPSSALIWYYTNIPLPVRWFPIHEMM
mgnify:CR=1 FL=1